MDSAYAKKINGATVRETYSFPLNWSFVTEVNYPEGTQPQHFDNTGV